MPDWNTLVRQNLNDLRLGSQEEREVIAELAGHLEETFEQLRADGIPEAEALRLTLGETTEWKQVNRAIRGVKEKENAMNYRTRALWLPGLVTFTSASIFLMTLQQLGLHAKVLWKYEGALVFHLPWLLLLPVCGAAGAYLSRRGGGTLVASLTAGLFPSVVMLCVFCTFLPIAILLEHNSYVIQHPLYFVLATLDWTLVPGVALLAGALPASLRIGGRVATA